MMMMMMTTMPVHFFFVFCKHQTGMMNAVIEMIREIENVYEEKPLIRSPEYKMGLSLFVLPFNISPLV